MVFVAKSRWWFNEDGVQWFEGWPLPARTCHIDMAAPGNPEASASDLIAAAKALFDEDKSEWHGMVNLNI